MEILIVLALLAVVVWFFFLRETSSVSTDAPYKIETPPTSESVSVDTTQSSDSVTQPAVKETDVTVTASPTAVSDQITDAVTQSPAPVKKPRKPRVSKPAVVEMQAAKKAAPVKKAAAIKAAPKKPTTPKSKKA